MKKSVGKRGGKLFVLLGIFTVLLFFHSAAVAAPVIEEIEDRSIMEDRNLLLTFSIQSPAPAALAVSVASSNAALIPASNISLTGSGTSRTLTAVPLPNANGETRIRISASDGTGTHERSFDLTVIPVNDPPVIDVPEPREMDEGTTLTFGTAEGAAIVVDDPDAGNNPVETRLAAGNGTIRVSPNSGAAVTGNETGVVVLSGTLAQTNRALDGMIYMPEPHFFGPTSIEIRVDDKGHTGEPANPFDTPNNVTRKSVEILVRPVNDPPEIFAPPSAVTPEDVPLVFGLETENRIRVFDIDAGENPIRITVSIDKGLLSVREEFAPLVSGVDTPEISFDAPQNSANEILDGLTVRVGPVREIDDGFGRVRLAVERHWSGEAVLEIRVNDLGHTGSGGPLTDTWTIPIVVTPVNNPPRISLASPTLTMDEDGRLLLGAGAIVVSDVDAGDNAIRVSLTPSHGELTVPESEAVDILNVGERGVQLEGAIPDINEVLGGLLFAPDPDWHGQVSLDILADDRGHSGEGGPQTAERTLTIVVRSVPDPPVLETVETIEMTPIEVNAQDPAGRRISDLLRNRISHADGIADQVGMAVVFADRAGGRWQFSTDDGGSWALFPDDVSESRAVLLGPDARIRFLPATDWQGFAELDFRLWDGTDGVAGGTVGVDIPAVGGRTPFSAEIGMVSIQVGDPPPLRANAGPDRNVVEGETVMLDGSASATPEDATTMFRWTQLAGPEVLLSDDEAVQPVFTAPEVGAEPEDLVFRLTLTVEDMEPSIDDVIIVVLPDMTIVADAGPDRSVLEGDVLALDGTGSRIPEGLDVSAEWTRESGIEVVLSDADTLTPSLTAPAVDETETLEFRLTLTGSDGAESSDTVRVFVANRPKVGAEAGPDRTVEEGEIVVLSGANSFVAEGFAGLYSWTQTAGELVSLSNPAAMETSFIAPSVAENEEKVLVFALEVVVGDESDVDEVSIRVIPTPPSVVPPAANAGPDRTVDSGAAVTLSAAGSSAPGGEIVAYQWTELTDYAVALSNPAGATTTFRAPSGGAAGITLRFRLVVTDNGGLTAEDTVSIAVRPATLPPGPGTGEPFDFREGENVTLTVSPSEDFGTVTSHRWTQISGTAVTLSDPNASRPTFVPGPETAGQTLAFEATLTNARGQTQAATIRIRVLDNGISGYPEDAITFRPTTHTTMGIRTDGTARVVRLEPVDVADTEDAGNRPRNLPFGLISFDIRVENPGDAASATLFLQTATPSDYRWHTYDAAAGWRDFSANAPLSADRARIALTLVDGGAGDEDGAANGIIRHTGAVGSTLPGTPGTGGGDGDSGGGCFIRSLFGSE